MRFPALFGKHPREDLSAYTDGELTPARVEALKSHLSSCPPCRAELDALHNLKSQVAALPEAAAPRSFALTPANVQRPAAAPTRALPPGRVAVFSNGLRLAGAGMSVALAVVMVIAVAGSGGGSGSDDNAENAAVARNEAAATDISTSYDAANSPATSASALPIDNAQIDATTEPAIPPPTFFPGTTSAPSEGGVGGVGSGPSAGVGTGGDVDTGATPGALDAPPGEFDLATPSAGGVGEASPSAAPVETAPADKEGEGFQDRANTNDDSILGLTGAPEADQTAALSADNGSGGGADILLIVAIALAAGVVLAFAGSVLLPRLARDEQ